MEEALGEAHQILATHEINVLARTKERYKDTRDCAQRLLDSAKSALSEENKEFQYRRA